MKKIAYFPPSKNNALKSEDQNQPASTSKNILKDEVQKVHQLFTGIAKVPQMQLTLLPCTSLYSSCIANLKSYSLFYPQQFYPQIFQKYF